MINKQVNLIFVFFIFFFLQQRSINGSNNSFNSLLDNVALDASQNYDESTTTTTTLATNTNNKINLDEDEYNNNSNSNNETQVHPMFTSRTYIKVI